MNKPVITYKPNLLSLIKDVIRSYINKRPSYSMAHLINLGRKAITYTNTRQLYKIFTKFNRSALKKNNYDCFSKYFNSQKIIYKFYSIIKGSK